MYVKPFFTKIFNFEISIHFTFLLWNVVEDSNIEIQYFKDFEVW